MMDMDFSAFDPSVFEALFDEGLDETSSGDSVEGKEISSQSNSVEDIILTDYTKKSRKGKYAKRAKAASFVATTSGGYTLISKKLTIFPSFEKSDFLLYLPKVMCKAMNEGNFDSMRSLIHRRCNGDCRVVIHDKEKSSPGPESLVDFYQMVNEFYPDSICFNTGIYSTGSEVHSRFAFKRTSVVSIENHARMKYFGVTRPRIGDMAMVDWTNKTANDRHEIEQLLSSNDDLTVHGMGYLSMYFDENKRIRKFDVYCTLTSMERCKFPTTE